MSWAKDMEAVFGNREPSVPEPPDPPERYAPAVTAEIWQEGWIDGYDAAIRNLCGEKLGGFVPCSICDGQPSDPVHDGGPKGHPYLTGPL